MKFPYERPRAGQLELADFIARSCRGVSITIVNAPTGFGKTVSVLYAFAKLIEDNVWDRVVYTVRTRNELDPVIRECRRLGVSFSILYSVKRMCPYARKSTISSESFWAVCTALRLKGLCRFYLRAVNTDIEGVLKVLGRYEDHASIAKGIADELNACPYFTLMGLVDRADVVVLTYPYVFKESIRASTLRDLDVSRSFLIVDEAHNLLNIGSMMGESIGLHSIEKTIAEAVKMGAEDVAEAMKSWIKFLRSPNDKGYRYIGKEALNIDKSLIRRIESLALDAVLKAVKSLRDDVAIDMDSLDLSLSRIAKFLYTAIDENYDLFISVNQFGVVSLSALPVNFIPLKEVLEMFPAVILMSGTPPSTDFVSRCIGVSKRVQYVDVEDFGARNHLRDNTLTVVFTSATTSYRARDEPMYSVYRKLVESVYSATPRGVVMAVYPSYEVMSAVVSGLETLNIVVEGEEPLADVMQKVLSRDKVLLNAVAGGRLTEGIEIVYRGESLVKSVVIVGVPYPQPDDYTELLKRNTASSGRLYEDYYKDVAVVRVLQAIGRAIRSENDYVFVVLADKRFAYSDIVKRLRLRIRAIISSIERVAELADSFFCQLA